MLNTTWFFGALFIEDSNTYAVKFRGYGGTTWVMVDEAQLGKPPAKWV